MVTIHDVAQRAGVTIGTVSRFLNGHQLRKTNEERVRRAIEETGYRINFFAKGLRGNKSLTVGIVIKDLKDIFASTIASIIEDDLGKEDYSIIVCDFQNNAQMLSRKLQFLLDRTIDGLVLFSRYEYVDVFEEYRKRGIPIVLMGEDIPRLSTDKIHLDHVHASLLAAEHLTGFGHSEIAIINGQQESFTARERYRGFIEATERSGISIPDRFVEWSDFTITGGYASTLRLMKAERRPTALYITNYYMTVGALTALNEMKLKVPDDVSLIGFDRLEPVNLVKPAVTAVEQPIERMAREASQIILRRMKGDYSDYPKRQVFIPTLFEGDSVLRRNP